MNETPRTLPARHRARLAAALGTLALALAVASACANPVAGSAANPHACADKVVQSLTTNAKVAGLWACLTPKFQATLGQYHDAGLIYSTDDAAFTDGTSAKPPVIGSHFVGSANGVDVYVVIVQGKSGPVTVTFTIWVDSSGKVENLAIGSPLF